MIEIYQTKKGKYGFKKITLFLDGRKLKILNESALIKNQWILQLRVTKKVKLFHTGNKFNIPFGQRHIDDPEYYEMVNEYYQLIQQKNYQKKLIKLNPEQFLTHPIEEIRELIKNERERRTRERTQALIRENRKNAERTLER